jgi:hypothetical protein
MSSSTLPDPPALLHFHQFKNGGSTLDIILEREFGHEFLSFHGDSPDSNLLEPDMKVMLAAHPDKRVFTSHHFRLPIDGMPGAVPLLILRHPLDRLPSIYEQERRSSPLGPGDAAFKSMSDWLDRAMLERPSLVCDAQVRFLACGGVFLQTDECLLAQAMRNLRQCPYFGIVSEYDRSMVLLEELLRRWWPRFSAAYLPQNTSQRDPSIERRLSLLREVLAPDVYQRALLNNRYDLALFQHARVLLDRRCKAIAGFDGKLEDLRSRCAALR